MTFIFTFSLEQQHSRVERRQIRGLCIKPKVKAFGY